MRLLVLGGSVFLSRAVAADAVRRGHDVVCACRGTSGSVPDGAELVVWDRAEPAPDALMGSGSFDAVVDIARLPSRLRSAVAAFPDAHWVFVSTVNVYADDATSAGRLGALAMREPRHEDVDLADDPEAYGPMKLACESIVCDGAAASSMVVRPGLIVGPGDPSGRFGYWPARFGRVDADPQVLAPGDPDDLVQAIDVRDLAAWIVDSCETRREGVFDGVGPVLGIGDLLAQVAAGCSAEPRLVWVDQSFLQEQGVEPWSGPSSIPLWLPRPAYDAMFAHDPTPSFDAGLAVRSLAETARDTLDWLRADPAAAVTGISPEQERELLDAWRTH